MWSRIGVLKAGSSEILYIGDQLVYGPDVVEICLPKSTRALDCWVRKVDAKDWGTRVAEFVICMPNEDPGKIGMYGLFSEVGVDSGSVAATVGDTVEDSDLGETTCLQVVKTGEYLPRPWNWERSPDASFQPEGEKLTWNQLHERGVVKEVPPPDAEEALKKMDARACSIAHLNNIHMFGEGRGCVVSSGYGDGGYDVFVSHSEDGSFRAAKVVFIEEDECSTSEES